MAARTRFFRARSLILSPSKKSIARHALPPRPALKSLSGSGRIAPWAKVSFTLSLWALPTAIIPSRDHTGLPIHFHSSMISRSASRMVLRMLANILAPVREFCDQLVNTFRWIHWILCLQFLHEVLNVGYISSPRCLRHVEQCYSLFYCRRLGRYACVLPVQAGVRRSL